MNDKRNEGAFEYCEYPKAQTKRTQTIKGHCYFDIKNPLKKGGEI